MEIISLNFIYRKYNKKKHKRGEISGACVVTHENVYPYSHTECVIVYSVYVSVFIFAICNNQQGPESIVSQQQ